MKNMLFGIILSIFITTPIIAMDNSNIIVVSFTVNIGTFSAGENEGGSIFSGGSLSLDWIPNKKIGLSYGLETALLGGKKQDNIIFGIPLIFRFGWHPDFLQFKNINTFLVAKIGWGFGIWGANLAENSTSGGIVCGLNFGAGYALASNINVFTEIGYNYYGLARNSNYPEYPLGYGSGKVYTSIGLSLNLF
jgi:hypothetical protein